MPKIVPLERFCKFCGHFLKFVHNSPFTGLASHSLITMRELRKGPFKQTTILASPLRDFKSFTMRLALLLWITNMAMESNGMMLPVTTGWLFNTDRIKMYKNFFQICYCLWRQWSVDQPDCDTRGSRCTWWSWWRNECHWYRLSASSSRNYSPSSASTGTSSTTGSSICPASCPVCTPSNICMH